MFNKVAADIHLDAAQSTKFTRFSSSYADKAIAIVKNEKIVRCDKMDMLRQTLRDYSAQLKQVLSPEQITMLRGERDKYHFGRRFVSFND